VCSFELLRLLVELTAQLLGINVALPNLDLLLDQAVVIFNLLSYVQ
jgi:hypothetical protein